MPLTKKPATGQKQCSTTDRISVLPRSILHHILSFLDTDEACRTSTLSKQWRDTWSSIPVLDFQPHYFKNLNLNSLCKFGAMQYKEFCMKKTLSEYVGFINKTMQRYFTRKLPIEKLTLRLPAFDSELKPMVDNWVRIAVENGVQELYLSIPDTGFEHYVLHELLFQSKSLRVLECHQGYMPCYLVISLPSLESFRLFNVSVDKYMVQHIVSLCRLTDLRLVACSGLRDIALPWPFDSTTKLEANVKVKSSPLRLFCYLGSMDTLWPFKMNLRALSNLRKVTIICAVITDVMVENLASELVMLEVLELQSCPLLKCVKISSFQLNTLALHECDELQKVAVDAPLLISFWYHGQPDIALSVFSTQQCLGHFCVFLKFVTIDWFFTLKKFLKESNIFSVLEVVLSSDSSEIQFDEEKLKSVRLGKPYELKELKLQLIYGDWEPEQSSVSALLDGLFWTCRPERLSVTACLKTPNNNFELVLDSLKEKAECWKHPLKGIEVEGANCSKLISHSELELHFRLKW